MGNTWSLANKIDELGALIKTLWEYRDCCILCFMETAALPFPASRWCELKEILHSAIRKKESGLLFVNEMWCNPGHVTVKEHLCSPNIKLLAVGMQPYYLPQEFTSVIIATVYLLPSAVAEGACVIHSTVEVFKQISQRFCDWGFQSYLCLLSSTHFP